MTLKKEWGCECPRVSLTGSLYPVKYSVHLWNVLWETDRPSAPKWSEAGNFLDTLQAAPWCALQAADLCSISWETCSVTCWVSARNWQLWELSVPPEGQSLAHSGFPLKTCPLALRPCPWCPPGAADAGRAPLCLPPGLLLLLPHPCRAPSPVWPCRPPAAARRGASRAHLGPWDVCQRCSLAASPPFLLEHTSRSCGNRGNFKMGFLPVS